MKTIKLFTIFSLCDDIINLDLRSDLENLNITNCVLIIQKNKFKCITEDKQVVCYYTYDSQSEFENDIYTLSKGIWINTEKIDDKHNDSFWYYNESILIVPIKCSNKNIKYLAIESRGEIKAYFEENGSTYRGEQCIKEANSMSLNDDDINRLQQNDMFIQNNWFACIGLNSDYECITDDFDICYTYDECIEMIIQIRDEIEDYI